MDCKEFLEQLDAYLDGELTAHEKDGFMSHAQDCPTCLDALQCAQSIHEALSHINDGLQVPLSAQAAWRTAVRKETKRKKGKMLYRALSAVAAAFVLLTGTTLMFRATGVLEFGTEAGSDSVYTQADKPQFYDAQPATHETGSASMQYAMVESDGVDDDTNLTSPRAGLDGASGLEEQAPSNADDSGALEGSQERLFSRSAVYEMYSESFDGTHQEIIDLMDEYNGNLLSDAVYNEGSSHKAVMSIDVPTGVFDDFLKALEFEAQVGYSEQNSEDISTNYYDTQGRIETLNAQKARLNELIPEAANAAELSDLNQQLEDIYAQIDTLESKLRNFGNQLDYSRVHITLHEGAALAATAISSTDSTNGAAKRGFSRSLESLGKFFSDMGVSLAIIAPYAGIAVVLIAAVWIAVVLLSKKRGHGHE